MEAGPVSLQQIDRELADAFGVPCDDKEWTFCWYNTIGFALACGKTFDEARELFADCPDVVVACDWLSRNFVANAWAEVGR